MNFHYTLYNAFFAVLSTEGRVVGLCWQKLKPKGPKGPVSIDTPLTSVFVSPLFSGKSSQTLIITRSWQSNITSGKVSEVALQVRQATFAVLTWTGLTSTG